jgi:hypothetical protein
MNKRLCYTSQYPASEASSSMAAKHKQIPIKANPVSPYARASTAGEDGLLSRRACPARSSLLNALLL